METNPLNPSNPERDKHLWKLAKKRVEFRRHLATYLIINAFFWALWYFTAPIAIGVKNEEKTGMPWPVYPMLGWGIGILFHFMGAFMFPEGTSSIEKEYDRLKNKEK